MLSAKNRPIGQVSCIIWCVCLYWFGRDSHRLQLVRLERASRSLLRFLKTRTGQESRGGEGMSDTATRPRLIFLPRIADYFFETGAHLQDKVL